LERAAAWNSVTTLGDRPPAPTGKDTQIRVRLQPDHITDLDAWIEKQEIKPPHLEAIRGMINAMLHNLAKDSDEKPAKKAKTK
jgi:hypothetical protein